MNQLTKEKGILDIINNTTVNKVNHQVSVKYFYYNNLSKLGENHYGATKRIMTLHNKKADKPEIASDINKYILEQLTNGNYVEFDIQEARNNKHQLCWTQLRSFSHQFIHQGENDNKQLHLNQIQPQPK